MTRVEWAGVLERIAVNWPQSQIPDGSAAKFYDDLKDFDGGVVAAAVEAIHRNGREWPPTSAHILHEIASQTEETPSFGEAWQMILKAIRSYGSHNPQLIVEKLTDTHPAVGQLAAQVGIRELGMAREGDTTRHAQAREMYAAICRKRTRQITHRGLPSAAVPALRDSAQPRRIGEAMLELVQQAREDGAA